MQSKTTTNTEQQNWFNDELELKKNEVRDVTQYKNHNGCNTDLVGPMYMYIM